MDLFVLLKFLGGVIFPPASTALGVLAGLLLGLRFPRLGRALIVLSILQSVILSLPIVADLLTAPLEAQAKKAAQQEDGSRVYDFIVVLSGGVIPANPPAMPTAHLVDGADRVIYAAQLFHRRIAPRIIASGGSMPKTGERVSESEALAIQTLLVQLGVPRESIILEEGSVNTLENVAFVQRIVGTKTVALVTSAYHMPRALQIARRLNLDAIAFPTDWRIPLEARSPWHRWLPTIDAMGGSTVALREYLAMTFDRRVPGS